MHNLITKKVADHSPSKMLNINKTNKSTWHAKHQPWSWIWERKQVRRRGNLRADEYQALWMEVRKLIEKMTGVCPVPLFSPTQFTKAACQVRYATYTHAYMYCMYVCLHGSGRRLRFFKYVWVFLLPQSFTSLFHFCLSQTRTLTHMYFHTHTHTLRTFTAICTSPNTQRKNAVANVLRYFSGISVSETKNSVFCVQVTDVQPFLNPLSQPHI